MAAVLSTPGKASCIWQTAAAGLVKIDERINRADGVSKTDMIDLVEMI